MWAGVSLNITGVVDPALKRAEVLSVGQTGAPLRVTSRLEDLHRSQRAMLLVRWIGAPWALLQVFAFEQEYPQGYAALAYSLIGVLLLGNLVIWGIHAGPRGVELARHLAFAGLALDLVVLSGYVTLFAFDTEGSVWALLFIVPLEGAIMFQLRGALYAWGVITILYSLREVWASDRYDYPLLWNSITYRMGLGGVIALVGGLMARDLLRQKSHLADALTEIQRIDKLRSGLVSMLGHDVRTPLTVIRGVAQTLLQRGDQISEEDRRALLVSADRQAKRLERLANDLLDLARLDEGRLELERERVKIEALVRDALTYIEGGEDITVSIEPGLEAMGDPQRLEQVVINLASNAVSHGKPPVAIKGSSMNGHVLVEVIDAGQGVPESELPILFEPFHHRKRAGSIGYGLAIVKALVEAQEGEVSYESGPSGGARFKIVLPRAEDTATA